MIQGLPLLFVGGAAFYLLSKESVLPRHPKPSDILIQESLISLGYGGGGDFDGTPRAVESFQNDWNWFIEYLENFNPDINYEYPYTKIHADGKWNDATELRAKKVLSKLDGYEYVFVENLGRDVRTFREMVQGFKSL